MSQQIPYNKATYLGSEINSLVNSLQGSLSLIRRINDQIGCLTYGDPTDYAAVATAVGLDPVQQSQQVADLVFLLAVLKTQLDTSPLTGIAGIARLDF